MRLSKDFGHAHQIQFTCKSKLTFLYRWKLGKMKTGLLNLHYSEGQGNT